MDRHYDLCLKDHDFTNMKNSGNNDNQNNGYSNDSNINSNNSNNDNHGYINNYDGENNINDNNNSYRVSNLCSFLLKFLDNENQSHSVASEKFILRLENILNFILNLFLILI